MDADALPKVPRRLWAGLALAALAAVAANAVALNFDLAEWSVSVRLMARALLELVLLTAVSVPVLQRSIPAVRQSSPATRRGVLAVGLALTVAVVAQLAPRPELGFPLVKWTMYSTTPEQVSWIDYRAVTHEESTTSIAFRKAFRLQTGRQFARQLDLHVAALGEGDPRAGVIVGEALTLVAERQGLTPIRFEVWECTTAGSRSTDPPCELLTDLPIRSADAAR